MNLKIIDTRNEIDDLIKEYSLIRVEKILELHPFCDISMIESFLDEWKEQSLFHLEYPNISEIKATHRLYKKLGNYFDYSR